MRLSLPCVFALLVAACVTSRPARAQTNTVAESVDLRPALEKFGLAPRRQQARPTCSVFTVTTALEFALASKEGKTPRLSPEFLNWAGNQTGGDHDDGGFFSTLWNGFEKHGICTESEMPYQPKFDAARTPDADAQEAARKRQSVGLHLHWIKEWNVNTGLTTNHFALIQQTLKRGWPVCAGLRWPKHDKWVDQVLQMCPPAEVFDGHSILLVGYRADTAQPGGGVFLFRNTSGPGPDGLMPYAYAREYMNDAVWIAPE